MTDIGTGTGVPPTNSGAVPTQGAGIAHTPPPGGSSGGGVKDKAAETKDAAKGAAQEVKGTAMEQASNVKDEAVGAAQQVKGEAVDHARQLLGEARSHVGSQAEDTTKQLAERLRAAADELQQLARNSEQPDGPVTQLVRQLGGQASTFAGRLDQGGYRGLTSDVGGYARRKPGTFLIAAAAAGFALGRVIRNADRQSLTQAVKGEQGGPDMGQARLPAMGETVTAPVGGDIDLTTGSAMDAEIIAPAPPERGGNPSATGVVM
jgi:uncharacterized protein YjbJ (UPF0337 family)